MQRFVKTKKVLCLVLVILLILCNFSGCEKKETAKTFTQMQDLADARIGIVTGTLTSILVPKALPDAHYQEFNATADAAMALESGMVDAYPTDESVYLAMLWEDRAVARIEEPVALSDYGVIFGKGENLELQEQFNAFLADFKASGELERYESKWFSTKEPSEFLSYKELTAANGTLHVGVSASQKPYVYLKNGQYAGFDIEMLTLFAEEYGYGLDFEDAQFGSVLTGVSTGVYDLGASGFTITKERAESVDFSDIYHTEDLVLVVKGSPEKEKTVADYQNAKVGVATGTYSANILPGMFPNAEIVEYNTIPDMVLALSQGKIDICSSDASYYTCMRWEGMQIDRLEQPIESADYGVVFQKGCNTELRQQMNAFIAELKENGTYDQLHEKWFGETEPTEFCDPDALTGTNGVIKVITSLEVKPFAYLKNEKIVGYDIDFLTLFAEEYGYQLEITTVTFSSILLGISQGSYDIGTAGFTITPERAESVDFSDPYHQEDIIFMIQQDADDQSSVSSGFESLREGFKKTFIRENRWKLILEGVITTMVISFFAVLGGTILGFLLYLAARSRYNLISCTARVFARIYAKLIAGTPTLVVLMLLFYVVFGKTDLDGIVVAIIGFILTFGSFVYGQLALTVEGVDKGQTEAAYALGYSRNQTFFRIVLPQAMKMFVPVYSSEIVGLIKATSVVGYIAVSDLTKMGDIIRSNTYEAFFPLIAVAVIYFAITCGVASLLDILRKKTEPKRRKNKDILKGVVR